MLETAAPWLDFFRIPKKGCEDSFGKPLQKMCLELHHDRYTPRKSEYIFSCFLVMKLVPTVSLEAYIIMATTF